MRRRNPAPTVTIDLDRPWAELEARVRDLARSSADRAHRMAQQRERGGQAVDEIRRKLARDFPPDVWRALPPFALTPAYSNAINMAYIDLPWDRKPDGLFRTILALEDLVDSAAGPVETPEQAAQATLGELPGLRSRLEANARDRIGVVTEALERMDRAGAWQGSTVVASPRTPGRDSERDWADVWGWEVRVGHGPEGTRDHDAPSFTLFLPEDADRLTIDDVIEGGDQDFFSERNAATQADYFGLINEIRSPGSSARPGRPLALYTARPKKDRARFAGTTHLPGNLFLTTSYDDAEGIAIDFRDRDVWRVRIDSRALVRTLDTPKVKHYQIARPEGVDITVEPELVARAEELMR